MIEYGRFTNVRGDYIDFNEEHVPFNEFTTEVNVRNTDKDKSQEHGIYPGNTYLGRRLFHCSGDLLENTSADYWNRRRRFIRACMPRPHLGYKEIGTLNLRLTGMSEDVSALCTLDGYPEMPLAALSPSAGKYQVNFKAFDPRLYGSWQQVDIIYGFTENIGGRIYNKTYNKTYAAGSAGNDTVITNSGDIETYPVITFYGPVTNPRLTLIRSDGIVYRFGFSGLSLTGSTDSVVVDMGRHTAVFNGSTNVYRYSTGSDWFAFEPDPFSNIVRYTADSGGVTSHAIIQWRNAYMI